MTPSRRALLVAAATTLPLLASGPALAWGERLTGSGRSATETRAVTGFDAIGLSGSMDLRVRQTATDTVEITADDNLLPYLETVLEGSRLQVRWKRGTSVSTRSKVVVTVGAQKLRALSIAGSGDAVIDDFNTPSLSIAVSGSGSAKLNKLATEDLSVRIAGSGDVGGDGRATKLSVSISGSGDVKLTEMLADEVNVRIAGSGDAKVRAEKKLDVSIAGSGDVGYTGSAKLSSSVAGSGRVRQL
jgi:hypothetical protein